MPADSPTIAQQARVVYWQRVKRLTLLLLSAWFLLTFGILFFARELARFTLFGWPFSFYMAAQGMVLMYLLIVACHAWCMRRLDRILKDDISHGC